jgi:hypothetical protein
VEASEDELQNKMQAQISKVMRTLILRLVPADIIEEAMARCVRTLKDGQARDPDAARKQLCEAYMGIGVTPELLAKYLGHPLAQMTADEYAQLRSLGASIRDGHITWADALEARLGEDNAQEAPATEQAAPAPAATPATGKGTQAVKEQLRAKRDADKTPPAPTGGPLDEPDWMRGSPPPVDSGKPRQ